MSDNVQQYPMEVEGKYRVEDIDDFTKRLRGTHAIEKGVEHHEDHYLRHPARDFRVTDEALRMRRVNDTWCITYKGPRREGPLKSRPEIELPLAANTYSEWMRIWNLLGFEPVAVVEKTRRVFSLIAFHPGLHVTLDHVEGIGDFAEIECVVHSPDELLAAERAIQAVANDLGLSFIEKRSYLSMVLEQRR